MSRLKYFECLHELYPTLPAISYSPVYSEYLSSMWCVY